MKTKQIKFGAIISYITLAVNIIAGLIYTPWMVGVIGQSNYGLYTLANSLISIFMLDFGLGSAVSRFLSKYRAEGDEEAAKNILGVIYKLYLLIDFFILIILFILFFFLEGIYVGLTPNEMENFRFLYLIVAGFSIFSFPFSPLNGVLNAYEKFVHLKLCDLFNKLFTVISVVAVLNFYADVTAVIATNALVNLATIFLKLFIW